MGLYYKICNYGTATKSYECFLNRKALNDANECCYVNYTLTFYGHNIPITICEEISKNKELKDYAKEQEEYKSIFGNIVTYKKITCHKRSFTIEE